MRCSVKEILILLMCFVLLVVLSEKVIAANVTWTGGPEADNLASNPSNWSGNMKPQNGDDVVFDSTSKDCTWDLNVSLASLSIKSGYTGKVTLSSSSTLTIAKNFVSPNAPTGLSATAISSSQINLSWTDNSNNETGFKIERKIGANGTYTQIATIGANINTYSDTGLTWGTTYYYRTRAYNSFGDSTYSNEVSATTFATAPVATTNPATNITANSAALNATVNPNGSATTVYFQWGADTSYRNNTTSQSIGSGISGVSVTANITVLSAGTTYHYRVVAANAGGTSYGLNESFTTSSAIPNISASPSSYNFGSVNVGSLSSPRIFTISNTGTGNLVIGSIYLTGTNLDQFVIQNDTCSGITISPSASCTIEVLFIPTYVGTLTADLSIPSNDPDTPTLNIGLSGTGVAPQCL